MALFLIALNPCEVEFIKGVTKLKLKLSLPKLGRWRSNHEPDGTVRFFS